MSKSLLAKASIASVNILFIPTTPSASYALTMAAICSVNSRPPLPRPNFSAAACVVRLSMTSLTTCATDCGEAMRPMARMASEMAVSDNPSFHTSLGRGRSTFAEAMST